MKNYYFLFLLFFFSLGSTAQIVNIPDVNFKARLIAFGMDTSSDGEIQVSEALLITSLFLDNSNISSLEGIEAFTNLTALNCSSNLLTSLDISQLVNLKYLYCSNNNLTSLVLIPGIQELDCSFNQLTSINLMVLANLKGISVAFNQLTSLVFPESNFADGWRLDISGNEYTSIDLSPIHNTYLVDFACYNSKLTSLTIPNNFYDTIIENNQFLTSLDFKNGTMDLCIPDPPDICLPIFDVLNNPNLHFVCVDDAQNEVALFQGYFASNPNVLVSSYCDFTPGGNYNTISGTTTLDCGGSNVALNNQNINIMGWNNANVGHTYSNANGAYAFYTSFGSHTVSLQLEHPAYFTVTPASYTYNFTFNDSSTETANFCITPNGTHPDLEVTVLPLTTARPGFNAEYKIVIKNKGTETQSGSVAMTFDDNVLDFVTAIPNITVQNGGLLTWDFTNLLPFEEKEFTVTLNLNSPMEVPPVNNGDLLHYSVAINTAQADETPSDNHAVLNQTVVGSFDPNDKIVLEGSQVNVSNVEEYLNYLIRFQNTGTAAAENVVVKDILSNKFDINTLQMVSASHSYRSVLTQGGKLEVIFENINLPPTSVDEPGSHGYIAFKVKPRVNTVLNDVIENTASIYFDFNYPIVTNTVSTQFTTLGIRDNERNLFQVYPNPTSGVVNIVVSDNQPISKTTITTMLGQTVWSMANETTVDLSSLAKGTYFITVETDKGTQTQRILKL